MLQIHIHRGERQWDTSAGSKRAWITRKGGAAVQRPAGSGRQPAAREPEPHERSRGGGAALRGGGAASEQPKERSSPVASRLQPAPADRATWPEHVRALKIPPAWKDVRINPDPEGALVATGKDIKGRDQYVYSPKFRESQTAIKFARIKELEGVRDQIIGQNEKNMTSKDPVLREHADCASLVMQMGLRPGSDGDTKAAQKAYGATTLEGRHVVLRRGKVFLDFVGKKGVNVILMVDDPRMAKMLSARAAAAGAGGKLFPEVSDKSMLDYVHGFDGGGFKTKDFRTLLAAKIAQNAIAERPAAPKGPKEYKAACLEVAKKVAERLGNTPAVALSSYIPPVLFAAWEQGND